MKTRKNPQPEDGGFYLIFTLGGKQFALPVEEVRTVVQAAEVTVLPRAPEIMTDIEFLAGVLQYKTGMMLIPDIDKILTHDEENALKKAVKKIKKE